MVDLDTGGVLGIYYGGKFEKTTGMGVSLSMLTNDPMWSLAGIQSLSSQHEYVTDTVEANDEH